MTTTRTIQRLLFANEVEMGDIPIRQPLPNVGIDHIDPFLLIHHHQSNIPANSKAFDSGVGPHPHRGFSPVTFIYKGDVHHRDSRGNNSIVKEGGVQWMDAGMGIIHSERPSQEFAAHGGEQEIIQLWINTVGSDKFNQPAYYAIDKKEIPRICSMDEKVAIDIVAGEYAGKKGAHLHNSELLILKVEMKANSEYHFKVPSQFNLCIYNMDGRIDLPNFGIVDPYYLMWFKKDGDEIVVKAQADTRLLLLAGIPLNEPIAAYGPFVMNDQTQIMQAMKDYQMGKMGILIEE